MYDHHGNRPESGMIGGCDPALGLEIEMAERDAHHTARSVDNRVPNGARIYDFLLGGKDNFPTDRAAAQQLIAAYPDAAEHALANRRFLNTVVRVAAQEGLRQFIDLGTGIPTSPNVHEIADSVRPGSRVVYVDNDPVVAAHNRAWRAGRPGVLCLEADIGEPERLVAHPDLTGHIDRARPVAVIMAAVLHFTEEPRRIVETFRDWIAPGSWVIISALTDEDVPERQRTPVLEVYRNSTTRLRLRPRAEFESYFNGLDLLEPGIVEPDLWRNPRGRSFTVKSLAGVGRKT